MSRGPSWSKNPPNDARTRPAGSQKFDISIWYRWEFLSFLNNPPLPQHINISYQAAEGPPGTAKTEFPRKTRKPEQHSSGTGTRTFSWPPPPEKPKVLGKSGNLPLSPRKFYWSPNGPEDFPENAHGGENAPKIPRVRKLQKGGKLETIKNVPQTQEHRSC